MVVGGGVILAAWLLPSATSDRTPPADRARAAPAAPAQRAAALQDALVRDVEAAAARLRQYESTRPGARRRVRNPFRFREGPPPAASAAPLRPPRETDEPPATTREPAFRLIGVAERHAAGDLARIAILATPSDVHLAAPGDRVAGRFTVIAVLADAAELRDETTGAVVRLVLPPQ